MASVAQKMARVAAAPASERIREVYVFVATDKRGQERSLSFRAGDNVIQLFAVDGASADGLKRFARDLAREGRQAVSLLRFRTRELVEVIEP